MVIVCRKKGFNAVFKSDAKIYNFHLVIEDAHPLAESLVTNNLQHNPPTTSIIKTPKLQSIPILNHQLDFDRKDTLSI